MANYKIYLFIILLSISVIGIVAVVARYQREISAARERVDSLGSQVIETTRSDRVRPDRGRLPGAGRARHPGRV